MTTLTFHLARALGRTFAPGDEIVVTELDHHANVAPWQALERERGVDGLRRPHADGDGRPRLGRLRAQGHDADEARRRRRRLERPRHDQRRGRAAGLARAVGAYLRRCRPLRAAPPRGRARARLRLPGLLGLQVLRPARRRAVRPPRAARSAPLPQARARARRPRPNAPRPARRTTRASSGAAAAVDFLASLAPDDAAPRRDACARSSTRSTRAACR